ncbi:MAG: amidophosphoribosyltransferase [Theionarchaea archaeon]|nr:amidophosphoribosyltransferase [Theionarchaea archaeon]MBU7001656.1 amidophosphoribosyltransferase [Theionarchaea archaeon]MBU7020996.1 amidophosphoribosyltransferase [Theionarchaea archaeon]MBU7034365.1 amidophosphoribosyltransferase [Theionarchaea archaeon]MBU7040071.1 amidophosphoribosyltransferase [Theionarchaea archaeon]
MCGIVSIAGQKDNASQLALESLMSIQHRGQDSCGILCYNDTITLKKGTGLVSEVFSNWNVQKNRLAIGHVRYPTIGTDPVRDAQPFYVNYPYGIGLCHNGNIVNYCELREELMEKKRRLQSNCDGELLLNVMAEELIDNELDQAIENVMNRTLGSYSAVSIVADSQGKIVVFRDPLGIRPLVFGENGGFMAASESVALDKWGIPVNDVLPGEMIVVDGSDLMRTQLKREHHAHCMFEWVYFSRADSVIEGSSVYQARLQLGKNLNLQHDVDVAIPVPDTARPAALGFAEQHGIPYREGLIKNRYAGRSFIMGTQQKRERAVSKLNVIKSEVKDKKVALIDDSIVRGTTSRKIVSLIRKAGAKEVHLFSSCPKILYPCFYGIDFPSKRELIASRGEIDSIGADSVTYQTLGGLRKAIGLDDLCMACLDGDYPVECCTAQFETLREKEREGCIWQEY